MYSQSAAEQNLCNICILFFFKEFISTKDSENITNYNSENFYKTNIFGKNNYSLKSTILNKNLVQKCKNIDKKRNIKIYVN